MKLFLLSLVLFMTLHASDITIKDNNVGMSKDNSVTTLYIEYDDYIKNIKSSNTSGMIFVEPSTAHPSLLSSDITLFIKVLFFLIIFVGGAEIVHRFKTK